jgi:sec-independent protein translocase protein TatA
MGNFGFSEMLLVFIVALLVFGPKKLPELGKSLGKGIREFRKATDELKSSWQDQVKDIQAPLNDVKKDIHDMGRDLQGDFYKHLESETSEQTSAQTSAPEATTPQHPSQPSDSAVPKEHV